MEYTELFQAVKKNDIDTVKKFLNSDFDIAQKDNQIFIIACYNCCIDVVKLLIEDDRIDPNARNYSALTNIINKRDEELIDFVINHHKVDFKNLEHKTLNSILLMASLNDNGKLIDKILNIDFKIDHKKDILFKAIEQNRLNSVKALLKDERFNSGKIITRNIYQILTYFEYDDSFCLNLELVKTLFKYNAINISKNNVEHIIKSFIRHYAKHKKTNYIEIFSFLISLPNFDIESTLKILFSTSNTKLLEIIYKEKNINFLETDHFLLSFNRKIICNIEYLLTLPEFSFIEENSVEIFSFEDKNSTTFNLFNKFRISPSLFILLKYKEIKQHIENFIKKNYKEDAYDIFKQYVIKEKIKDF